MKGTLFFLRVNLTRGVVEPVVFVFNLLRGSESLVKEKPSDLAVSSAEKTVRALRNGSNVLPCWQMSILLFFFSFPL